MERLLSQTAISRLKPGDYLADRQTPGLRVEAFKARKSFIYRFRDVRTGKLRQVTIGDAEVVSIADARDQVRALQRARKGGADPRRVFEAPVGQILKQESQTNYSIRSLVNDYCADKLAPLKRGAERERMLRNDLSAWFPREAASVSRVDVRELVDSIVTRAPDIAGRVLRELRAAYKHAAEREQIPEGTDPTHGIAAPRASRYVPRDRAFTEGEWRQFARWLPKSGISEDVRDALMLIALTACRPGEATSARWSDVDVESGTWTIRERKRGSAHVVFLSIAARSLLRRRRRAAPDAIHVFPSPMRRDKPVREHALVWAITQARHDCPLAHWTAHDLQRSSATLLQSKGVRFEVVRRVLGHYSTRNPTDIYARQGFDAEAKAAWGMLGATLSKLGAK